MASVGAAALRTNAEDQAGGGRRRRVVATVDWTDGQHGDTASPSPSPSVAVAIDCRLIDRLLGRRLAEDKLGESRDATWCKREGITPDAVAQVRAASHSAEIAGEAGDLAVLAFQIGIEAASPAMLISGIPDFHPQEWCGRHGVDLDVLERVRGIYGTYRDRNGAAASAWQLGFESRRWCERQVV